MTGNAVLCAAQPTTLQASAELLWGHRCAARRPPHCGSVRGGHAQDGGRAPGGRGEWGEEKQPATPRPAHPRSGSPSWLLRASFGPEDPRSNSRYHPIPIYHPEGKAKGPELKHAQVFGSAEAPWEDGGVVVGRVELGQVGDLAAGDPCRLRENVPGKEHRAPHSRFSVRWEKQRGGAQAALRPRGGMLTCDCQVTMWKKQETRG